MIYIAISFAAGNRVLNMKNEDNEKRLTWLGKLSGQTRVVILELVLIVAGILIALAIDQWREGIDEAKRADVFLQQLVSDLASTEKQMADAADRTLESEQLAENIVNAFESGHIPTIAELRDWLAKTQYVNNPVPVLGTAEALVSTGDLRHIAQSQARSNITGYLSRSRDFWLVPLYNLEEFHADLYHELLTIADEYGITPSHRKGRIERTEDKDIYGFFASSRAYVAAAKLSETKHAMAGYRRGMAQEARELKESLVPLLHTD
jgi:cell division protein ZapA (FtsZ GTPase activity inhibitor)